MHHSMIIVVASLIWTACMASPVGTSPTGIYSEHSLTTPPPHPKITCVGVRTPFDKLPAEYQKTGSSEFHITCDQEGPIPMYAKDSFHKCAAKCHKHECVAWLYVGDEHVGKCESHQRWLMGAPMEAAIEKVKAAEAEDASHDPISGAITTWSFPKHPVGDEWPSTADLEFSIPSQRYNGWTFRNPEFTGVDAATSSQHHWTTTQHVFAREPTATIAPATIITA